MPKAWRGMEGKGIPVLNGVVRISVWFSSVLGSGRWLRFPSEQSLQFWRKIAPAGRGASRYSGRGRREQSLQFSRGVFVQNEGVAELGASVTHGRSLPKYRSVASTGHGSLDEAGVDSQSLA